MLRERIPDYDVLASPEDEPIRLTGPPNALRGRVMLRNPGDEKVVLRYVGLTSTVGEKQVGSGVRNIGRIVLQPEQEQAVPLQFAVDRSTPAGTYRVELMLAGRPRAAILEVAEDFDLSLAPARFVIENRPGVAQTRRLLVTNTGNVPFDIGDIPDVDLRDDRLVYHAGLEVGTTWSDDEEATVEDLLVAILRAAQEQSSQTGKLEVRNTTGTVTVGPDETVGIDLTVTVPADLHDDSRYTGNAPLFTRDVGFVVVPHSAAASAPAPPPRAQSTTKKASPAKSARGARKGQGGRG